MEFYDLGQHCFFCKQQDYLPFKCINCKKFFCKEHKNAHECNSLHSPTTTNTLTAQPTHNPSMTPTADPTHQPTAVPTVAPTVLPTPP